MQSAQEFFETYLREKTTAASSTSRANEEIYERFFARDFVEHYSRWKAEQNKNPESISAIEISDKTASFITTSPNSKRLGRYRYQLRFLENKWEIHKQEIECPMCKATGQSRENSCHFCGGMGWRELFVELSDK
jgi:hypothetical protein